MIRLVCFDLGGVIVRICRTWAEGCAAAGIEMRNGVDPLSGSPDGWQEMHELHQTGRIDLLSFARRCSRIMGGAYTPEEIVRVHEAWTLDEYEGVGDLVERIHEAGIETAVLSNTTHEHWVTFDRYPTFTQLRNRFGSHELALRKPDPAAYRAIEDHTGCSGAEILFFDDLPENIDAARGLGWRVLKIDPSGSTSQQMERALVEHDVLR